MIIPTVSLPHYPARPCRPQGGFGLVMMMMRVGVANALSANCLKVCTWLRIGSEDRSDPDFQNPQSLCISAANWPHFQCLILRSAFIRQGFSQWCKFRLKDRGTTKIDLVSTVWRPEPSKVRTPSFLQGPFCGHLKVFFDLTNFPGQTVNFCLK